MADRVLRFRIVPHEDGKTLGQIVSQRLPELQAGEARALVKAGGVYMGHLRVRVPSTRVVTGERITVYPDALQQTELDPNTLRFVFRDETFVIVDKPSGVPVAATKASARGTLGEALRRQLAAEGVVRPYVGTVHRLDQGASGLVLFTTRGVANRSLHALFSKHRIRRIYRVRVCGPTPPTMECDAALAPRPGSDSMRVAKPNEPRAKPARTIFRTLEPAEEISGTSLVEVELETGRTHQIRIHAATLGFPVLGDRRYGANAEAGDASVAGGHSQLHLHAYRLVFEHPDTQAPIDVTAELPGWATEAQTETKAT